MKYRIPLIGLVPLILAACGPGESTPVAAPQLTQVTSSQVLVTEQPDAKRWFGFQHARQGGRIFKENCASCHGLQGEGAINWQQPGPDGKFQAPPLNGSGHAWHHPLKMLAYVIKNGSPGSQGNMPAWKEKLTDEEIFSVIAWFQSKWPQDIYNAWAERNAAQQGRAG